MTEPSDQPANRPPAERMVGHHSPEGAFYSATSSGELAAPGVTINIPPQNNQNSDSSWKSLGMVIAVAGLLLAAVFGGFQAGTYYMESVVNEAVQKAVSESVQDAKNRLSTIEQEIQQLKSSASANSQSTEQRLIELERQTLQLLQALPSFSPTP